MNQFGQLEAHGGCGRPGRGNSIRATVRMTGVAKNTVVKLLVELGAPASVTKTRHARPALQARPVRRDLGFVGAKQKNVRPRTSRTVRLGDVWTWTAIDADTKLIVVLDASDRATAGTALRSSCRTSRPARQPRPANHGRPQAVPERRGGCLRRRHRLRDAREALRRATPQGRAAVQPGRVHRAPMTQHDHGNPDPKHISPATSSARTSRCG